MRRAILFIVLTFLIAASATAGAFDPKLLQSVVTVLPERGDVAPRAPRGDRRNEEVSGSGVVIRSNGFIVTNNHVLDEARLVSVRLVDGRELPAEIVGRDVTTDIALLKVEEDLPPLPMAAEPPLGAPVCTVSDPFGVGLTVTCGVVSAVRRSGMGFNAIEDFIQTDAVINPGNSGGPMVNLQGQVVGINSAIASTTGVYQGYGFAIPIDLARRVMEDLIEYGHVKRPRIGVSIADVVAEDAEAYGLPSVSGVLVQDVPDDGPAYGILQDEDVIVRLDGEPVGYVSELQAKIAERHPGEMVDLTVYRDGEPVEVEIRLAEAPINDVPTVVADRPVLASERLGIQVEALNPQLAEQLGWDDASGVVLRDVLNGSAAERRGVGGFRGTKLTRINETEISVPDDVRSALEPVASGDVVSLHFVDRSGNERVMNVRMP